jgi:hypothetical protein
MIVDANPQFVARTETGVDWQVLSADVQRGEIALAYSANDVYVYKLPAAER